MSLLFKHIGLCIIGFMLTLNMSGQEHSISSIVIDDLLNQYEQVCDKCINLKEKVKSGSEVSRKEAKSLLKQFLSLNKEIKSIQDFLSNQEMIRFKRINQWFATGVRPLGLDKTFDIKKIDDKLLTNSGLLITSSASTNRLSIPKQFGDSKNKLKHFRNHRVFILANLSAPISYGFRAGYMLGGWGCYVSGKSNFAKCDCDYICSKDGTMDNGLVFWPSGDARRSNMSGYGGVMFNIWRWIEGYAGAGYGSRTIFWKDIEGKWATVSDLHHKGFATEIGVIASWKRLSVSAGVSTIVFRTISFDFGLGFNF